MSLNSKVLAQRGILVPEFFTGENHGELAVAFSTKPGRLARAFAVDSPEDQQELRKLLDRKLRQHLTDGIWLFSSEHLSTRLRTTQEIDDLYSFLTPHFDRIDVIANVRRPDDLAPSAFAETVKAGRIHPFNATYVQHSRAFFDHRGFADLWARPDDAPMTFTLRPYLREGLIQDMVNTMFDICKLNHLVPVDLITPAPAANASLSAIALRYLQEINPLFPDGDLSNRSRRRIIGALAQHEGAPLLLAPAVAEALTFAGLTHGGLQVNLSDPRWRTWWQAPPGATGQWPKLDDPTRAALADLCRQAGVDPTGSDSGPSDTGLTTSAKRSARRAAIRLTRW